MTFSFSFGQSNCPTYNKSSIDTLRSEGWIVSKDGTYVLAPAHDAAHVKWGGSWRMPTDQELYDLSYKCDWTWTTLNGVNGYVVRGRGIYASNSIFLPCAGRGFGTSLDDGAGMNGFYWSSVPGSGYGNYYDYLYYAWGLYLYWGGHSTNGSYRFLGLSVRPVQGFTN
jgi:hypothetical protein